MRVIVIGAGRGRRLMPTTADAPKCFAEVAGRRLLDWALEAFAANGLDRVCFIGGYQIEKVQQDYPRFTFRHNAEWENNNILASLFCAEDLMDEPFICCYSDVLFTPDVVARLAASPDDMVLGVDTAWLARYEHRTDHPPDDAEKVTVADGQRHARSSPDAERRKRTANTSAWRSSRPPGRRRLREHYHRRREQFAGQPLARSRGLRKGLQDSAVSRHDRSRRATSRTSTRRAATSKSIRSRISNTRGRTGPPTHLGK